MFGRGKEVNTGLIQGALEEAPVVSVASLPDFLIARLMIFEKLAAEYNELQKIQRTTKLPPGQKEVHRARVRDLESLMLGLQRIAKAVRLGYEPYTVPDTLYAGTIRPYSPPSVSLQFRAPMPREVIEKYQRAKETNLFSEFLVAGADYELFRVVSNEAKPSTLRVHPFLVGFVETEGGLRFRQKSRQDGKDGSRHVVVEPGLKVTNGAGFLIAHWDLTKDLRGVINS